MIDAHDVLRMISVMADKGEDPTLIAEFYERLTKEMDVPPEVQQQAFRLTIGQKNLEDKIFDKNVENFLLSITGPIDIRDVIDFFNAKGEQKQKIYHIMQQQESQGLIARTGNRHGRYRLIDHNPSIMNLSAPEVKQVKIELPFLLHDFVTLYARNIILVIGEKDAGKSAFAMNAAWMNRHTWKVRYFNSEMGLEELRGRLRKFNHPMNEWEKITWIEKAKQFEDFIDPDGLNIIDFLEVGAEAFTVTEDIRRVFDKLDNGLLLIVMQKRSYKEYAVGGQGTLEKARLAINLEHNADGNLARIVVAKNWAGPDNPRGKVCKYKVWNGAEMKMTDYWHDPEKNEISPIKTKGFQYKKDSLSGTDPDFPREI